MEETEDYEVNITSSGKLFYLDVIDQFYTYNSLESASRKADELYAMALELANFPERGQLEETLRSSPKDYRYILYQASPRQIIKIIYFIDKPNRVVYVTDFFPTRMDSARISRRNRWPLSPAGTLLSIGFSSYLKSVALKLKISESSPSTVKPSTPSSV